MRHARRILLCAAMTSTALVASAQNPPAKDPAHPQHGQPQAGAPSGQVAMMQGPVIWAGKDLVGMAVVSPTGEKLGKVEDVLVHPSGELGYAVVSLESKGEKLFVIPWSVVRPPMGAMDVKTGTHTLVLPIEKERFDTAPSFEKSAWPAMKTNDWSKEIDTFYRNDKRPDDMKQPVPAAARVAVPILRFSELEGYTIESSTGEKLGDVQRVALDPSGRVSYVVVDAEGGKAIAVPFGALKLAPEKPDAKEPQRILLLSADKARLEQAPVFEEARMSDPKWVSTVYEYYAVPIYWTPARDTGAQPPKKDEKPEKPK